MSREVNGEMSRGIRNLCLLHLPVNALLLWLAYEWLAVGESTRWRLVWSLVAALAILSLVCWLHGATFVYFRSARDSNLNHSFRTALRNLFPLVLAALSVLSLYGLIEWWAQASGQPALRLASWLTMTFRKPVKPATVVRVFQVGFWLVRWVLLPVLLLPLASGLAARGWRGFADFGRGMPWREWLLVPILLLCGLWAPFIVFGWVPRVNSFALQVLSFLIRIGVAYSLFVAAAVGLAYMTSRGRRQVG